MAFSLYDADPKCIVIEEITKLERELATTYQLSGSSFSFSGAAASAGYVGTSGIWIRKAKSPPHLFTSDSEDDDSSDDFHPGSTLGSSSNISTGGPGNDPNPVNSKNFAYFCLKKLKSKVQKNLDITTDIYYLIPFCDIIKDENINGFITASALESLLEFINCGFIAASEELGSAQLIAESVLRTRFTGTHTQNDEMVLGVILAVMREIIVSGFKSISNETVCGIMHSSLEIAFEHRLSDNLRRQAKKAIQEMCRTLFNRLDEFDDIPLEYGHKALKIASGSKFLSFNTSRKAKVSLQSIQSNPEGPSTTVPISQATITETNSCTPSEMVTSASSGSIESLSTPTVSTFESNEFVNNQGIKFTGDAVPYKPTTKLVAKTSASKTHDLVCIHGILSHLTQLISHTNDNRFNEDYVETGFQLLRTIFSIAVNKIGRKQFLLAIVKDQLCFNILQFLRYDRPLKFFFLAISLTSLILIPLRIHLKYQMEFFLTKLMGIVDSDSAPLSYREAASDCLCRFFQDLPYFCHEMFFNYDCNPFSSNLYEDLLHLFDKCCSSTYRLPGSSYSNQGTFTTIQRISFDTLLTMLRSLQKAEFYSKEIVFKYCNHQTDYFINFGSNPEKDTPLGETMLHQGVSALNPSNSYQFNNEEAGLCEIAVIKREDIVDKSGDKDGKSGRETLPKIPVEMTHLNSDRFDLPKNIMDIESLKLKKRYLWKACELFNSKPSEGIKFLEDHGFIKNDADIISFIQDNLRLDKKQIGEYLTKKNNRHILKQFVQSFAFKDTRIDEALRLFQESFRLPGEAALIEPVLEEFSSHWHESNQKPFLDEDAACRLAYAIIMLHTHQHNPSAKKDLGKMTCEQFIRNLRGMNGGQDFDPSLLQEIFEEIDTNEIVLPFEQHGVVREKYLWKCILRKSETAYGVYWYASKLDCPNGKETDSSNGHYRRNIQEKHLSLLVLNEPTFLISWGPILSAITVIFNQVNVNQNVHLTRRIVNQGFAAGAYLCAKYGHLDDLLLSLCKFTKAFATGPSGFLLPPKSQLAAQCLFHLAKEYVNEIRGSWIGIMRIIVDWFIAGYLDDLFEFDDFALGKKVSLKRQRNPKSLKVQQDSSSNLFTSLVSYLAGSTQESFTDDLHECYSSGNFSKDYQECSCSAHTRNLIVEVCKPLSIIEESKFLHPDPLTELIKALINLDLEMEDEVCDDVEAFRLEMLVHIVLSNRDRATYFWQPVLNHLTSAAEKCSQSEFFSERYISAIFRLGMRFLQRPDAANEQIFQLIQHIIKTNLTESCALKLLSLMHSLHISPGITAKSDDSEYLWSTVWCPLLQGMSLLCYDHRRTVRNCALNFLQRALLNHDMRILTANQWENCFNKVLFPLLAMMLEVKDKDKEFREPFDLDQARTRAINLTCKVFLQHLQSLLQLPTFTALWLTILDFMDKFMKNEAQTDLVKEAIPESLKNVLLVMDTANCFDPKLASITWDKIHCFLPKLKEEIMPPQPLPPVDLPALPINSPLPSPLLSPTEEKAESVLPPVTEIVTNLN